MFAHTARQKSATFSSEQFPEQLLEPVQEILAPGSRMVIMTTTIILARPRRLGDRRGIQRGREQHSERGRRHNRKLAAGRKELSTIVVNGGSGVDRWFVQVLGHDVVPQ